MLTMERVREIVRYDPLTGIFTRLRGEKVGGCLTNHGYRVIRVDQVLYTEHRLAWFYVHGAWPPNDIDHINGKRADNRIENLRLATRYQNLQNKRGRNRTGFKGVLMHRDPKRKKRYGAQIAPRGKAMFLGWYETPEEAHAAYRAKANELYGVFARYDNEPEAAFR